MPLDVASRLAALLSNLPGRTLVCDHCGVSFVGSLKRLGLPEGTRDPFEILAIRCASCRKYLVFLAEWEDPKQFLPTRPKFIARLWPGTPFVPLPAEVPEEFAKDFREANAVMAVSPKASAALGRRLLQRLLRETAGIKKKDLSREIEEFLKTNPPSYVAEALDGIRAIGNFAAHPLKSTRTGEVMDVEPGEAEWILATLSNLFDHLFLQPARLAAQRASVNQKLQEAGKPPIRQSTTKPNQ
jgi:hypothetical protein